LKIRLPNGKTVNATQMDFKPVKEDWNVYRLEDGTLIKVKVVASEIYRLESRDPVTGKHNYLVRSENVISVVEKEEEVR